MNKTHFMRNYYKSIFYFPFLVKFKEDICSSVFRSTQRVDLNKAGLKCPYVRPQSYFDFNA